MASGFRRKASDMPTTNHGARARGRWGTGSPMRRSPAAIDTRLYDVSDEAVGKGRGAIEQIVKKGVELGKVSAPDADAMLARLSTTTSLAEALQDADLVIEAAPEKIDLKLALFAADRAARARRRRDRLQYVGAQRDRARRLAEESVSRRGDALLQSRPQDEADRDRAGARERARDARGDRRGVAADGQGDRAGARVARVHHHPRQRQHRQRGVLHADGRASPRRATSTRR